MFNRIRIQLASLGVAACLGFTSAAWAAGEPVLGRVLYSYNTTVGASVPGAPPQTILNDDVMTTSADGSALVEFQSGGRLKVMENSKLRFVREQLRIQVELEKGTVVVETGNNSTPPVAVSTAKYRFDPAQAGDSRYMVRLGADQGTTAAAMTGNVLVRPAGSDDSYVLHQSQYAVIDPGASGTPSQPSTKSASVSKHGGWRIGSLSEGDSVALAVGIAAGAAAGIAIPLTRKSAASPSEP